MYKRLLETPDDINLRAQYNCYRNKLDKIISRSKKMFAQKLIKNNVNQSSALWECVNQICSRSKPEIKVDKINSMSGQLLRSSKDISNSFNLYYSTLGQSYADKIVAPDNYTEKNKITGESMFLYPTNIEEVYQVIMKLKSKKSPGHDNIRVETLKNISDEIKSPLTHLINRCFDRGYFPKALKKGVIKPIFKSGNRLEMVNYRPISLISNISKIIEKIMKVRILKFCKKHKIISDHQYGFTEGKSTEDAIHQLTTYIYNSLDKSKPSLCIFLDLSNAFDTVSHRKLLERLYDCGMRGNTYKLLESYLTEREQRVCIDGELSNSMYVKFGVPQGTVLGPILFTLYINTLLTLNIKGKIVSFADDAAIFYEAETWQLLKTEAENDFRNIERWLRYYKLTINLEKTKYLPFSPYSSGLPEMGPLVIGPDTYFRDSFCQISRHHYRPTPKMGPTDETFGEKVKSYVISN